MEIIEIPSIYEKRKKRVAAYARVSTMKEDQEESYETQKEYYEDYIKSNPDWIFVKIYADHGLSATSAKHRPEFMNMIRDAKEGKIDMILVKSISRFSRNAVDAQRYTHELTAYNVEVLFDKEGVSSFNRNLEMIFNMLAMCAEQESRSISENTRWAYQRLAEQGIRRMGNNKVFGYDEIDGELVPNKDAVYVRQIFDDYVAGMSYPEIARHIESMGAKPMKKQNGIFGNSSIRNIVLNEIYTGDRIIQKTAPKNFFTKKPDLTIDYDSYYVEDHHPAIITKEVWKQAQLRYHKSKEIYDKGIHVKTNSHFLLGKVYCGECGEFMHRLNKKSSKYGPYWRCVGRMNKNGCDKSIVYEYKIIEKVYEYLGIKYSDERDIEKDTESINKIILFNDGRIDIE